MTEYENKLNFWKKNLSNLTDIQLPTDYARSLPLKIVESTKSVSLAEKVSYAIHQLSTNPTTKKFQGSPFTILLAAFSVLIHKYVNEEDITIGSSSLSCNPLVLRFQITDEDTIDSIIEKIEKVEQEAEANEVKFSDIIELFTVPNEVIQPSLFKVRFFNATDINDETLQSSTNPCDLTVSISQTQTLRRYLPINITVTYNSTLFEEARITEMLNQLQQVLIIASENRTLPVSNYSLITDEIKSVLPDPTADLHWEKFEGAITDIFARNAKEFPDRIFVTQTYEDGSIKQYDYKKMNAGANLVANYLISKGIQREDVVMIYAFRDVDLIVAIMGVLKAGATFSVIDPAYPPSRQNIYLEVAQPKGLIVLKKSGVLHDTVEEYIRDNLQIITRIPALGFTDEGVLKGGEENGVDVFDAVRDEFENKEPGVVIGPDSIGTLSFTSGSTGIPKGVRGRHFSLTHFYPWMREEFGLSEKDKFTLLSGIAHDPIQRDIFTPIFLGAQLLVPTAEDIGTPGRLAEWMSKNEITVTHLTPAMGQLLSANAVALIPSLKNAFFVGDVLTKRDIKRLQNLAKNTTIINMYGTTETQRAVSYLKIPSINENPSFINQQKNIMPAGRGMKDVQLLVVNKAGNLCGVGEVGEIYVRSSGLSEGYLMLPEVTQAKFLQNKFNPNPIPNTTDLPFFKGPRDRMYKSGDLGRYRADGNVECTGRADDQVKIRGFRIELGEIDTHLSQHPNVRENVTLVRRDKNEEKTLVTYFVTMGEYENDTVLIRNIRDYLKKKLPSYAIPSVFARLNKMPLTPNGKIDKNSLPFPDTLLTQPSAAKKEASNKNMTDTEKAIFDIWMELINVQGELSIDDNFFDIGGHSILATRLVFQLRNTFSVDVPLGFVFKVPTIRGMSAEIDHLRGANTTEEEVKEEVIDYAADVEALDDPKVTAEGLPALQFPGENATLFLTGATGFLGTNILATYLNKNPKAKVYCLVRAKSDDLAYERLKKNAQSYMTWNDDWEKNQNVIAVNGDLSKENFGIAADKWAQLCKEVDLIIHNGAMVHWVYPYTQLKAINVLSTVQCLKLSTTDKLKPFYFVSSTSVLDTDYYVQLAAFEKGCVMENDDLEGSRTGLGNGYGQSKWVSEKLIFKARERGVPACVIRPGYIVGHTKNGVQNTDDFIIRMMTGCVQLKLAPNIQNTLNTCPVDYVAGSIVQIASDAKWLENRVYHMWNNPRICFNDIFEEMQLHGYDIKTVGYMEWSNALMNMTLSSGDNALFPLLHFVLDDLPNSSKSPSLNDDNTRNAILGSDVPVVNVKDMVGKYLAYLIKVGILLPPPNKDAPKQIPEIGNIVTETVGRHRQL
ncbi:large subunit of L-aminoadipate-semialdehyde dehydrogenase [Piromyces finnis]|uniref:Alpha-aminoadipate reductase n=1 Tax=Piromyces finnis TaxID=1754191 RepID=A0A1Y1V2N6_9FUNG|nr:large subunit of L-aminoadipate-semialdehyde dehydrogenase [Piromyces finnis]|eukprot:ORX45791.1 large subunit of L-aminoadipate-semialdehyde dehydrogenase [Piromyces finnis]